LQPFVGYLTFHSPSPPWAGRLLNTTISWRSSCTTQASWSPAAHQHTVGASRDSRRVLKHTSTHGTIAGPSLRIAISWRRISAVGCLERFKHHGTGFRDAHDDADSPSGRTAAFGRLKQRHVDADIGVHLFVTYAVISLFHGLRTYGLPHMHSTLSRALLMAYTN